MEGKRKGYKHSSGLEKISFELRSAKKETLSDIIHFIVAPKAGIIHDREDCDKLTIGGQPGQSHAAEAGSPASNHARLGLPMRCRYFFLNRLIPTAADTAGTPCTPAFVSLLHSDAVKTFEHET